MTWDGLSFVSELKPEYKYIKIQIYLISKVAESEHLFYWHHIIICINYFSLQFWLSNNYDSLCLMNCLMMHCVNLNFHLHLPAFYVLLYWFSGSPHHHYHHLADSDSPGSLIWAGIPSVRWSSSSHPFSVFPSLVCCRRRRTLGFGQRCPCLHHSRRTTGYRVGLAVITGWPAGHRLYLSRSTAACTDTHTLYGWWEFYTHTHIHKCPSLWTIAI